MPYTSTPNTDTTHLRQESHCTLKEKDGKSTIVISENKVGSKQKDKASPRRRHILCGQVLCGSVRRRAEHSATEAGSSGLVWGSGCRGSRWLQPSTVQLSTFMQEREGAKQGGSPEPGVCPVASGSGLLVGTCDVTLNRVRSHLLGRVELRWECLIHAFLQAGVRKPKYR